MLCPLKRKITEPSYSSSPKIMYIKDPDGVFHMYCGQVLSEKNNNCLVRIMDTFIKVRAFSVFFLLIEIKLFVLHTYNLCFITRLKELL